MHLNVKKTDISKQQILFEKKNRQPVGVASTGSRLDSLIIIGLMFVVVFTALAFGTVEAWSIFTFELLVIGLIVVWAIRAFFKKQFALKLPQITLPLIFLFLIGVLQSFAMTDENGGVH